MSLSEPAKTSPLCIHSSCLVRLYRCLKPFPQSRHLNELLVSSYFDRSMGVCDGNVDGSSLFTADCTPLPATLPVSSAAISGGGVGVSTQDCGPGVDAALDLSTEYDTNGTPQEPVGVSAVEVFTRLGPHSTEPGTPLLRTKALLCETSELDTGDGSFESVCCTTTLELSVA